MQQAEEADMGRSGQNSSRTRQKRAEEGEEGRTVAEQGHSLLLRPQLAGVLGTVMHDDHPEGGVPSPQLPQPLPHDGGGAHDDGGLEHATAVQAG